MTFKLITLTLMVVAVWTTCKRFVSLATTDLRLSSELTERKRERHLA
ncbi:MAG: hypothetical protein GY832_10210 [Chloroflexi bacterium]|nr:hypothetical protein [Chloroflexota bacterium]